LLEKLLPETWPLAPHSTLPCPLDPALALT